MKRGGESMIKQGRDAEIDIPLALITIIKANIMAYVVTSIFVLLASIIITYTDVTPKFEGFITVIGILFSAFLAGFDTAKIENKNGYRWGAVGGAFYFVIFLGMATIIDKLNQVEPGMMLLIALLVLLTSSIAGMISVNIESQTTYRR